MSQSLARALRILAALGEGERSLDELAAQHDVHKTTVLRLLRTLEEERFVYRDGRHRYHLGAQLFALSSRALEQRGIRATAAPHLAELNQSTGQTVHLATYEGGEVVYVDKYDSRHPVRMYSRIGLRASLHGAAVSKVLLGGLPPEELERVLARIEYRRTTPNTIGSAEELRAEVARAAERGWATDHEENEPSINCVAAPVRDASGEIVAAISISVPDIVLSYEELLELRPRLLETARAISGDAGWRPASGEAGRTGHGTR
ncbi:IclR family transcriptional regulator [Allostreptomyces psammosilenae]|uniref:DNA-binding IclR family transcriptional regulator n=1 Tax=Allostreptomyces psammosilenae TaxID=1892865 RepID=A0A853ACY2_9ACTN|nr:IclR family transcriptional regulator [Allostreptomyces psammosilenae]NYI08411.1 DNA-binding IclR family transcriptional regulator [Allostreptomyces psammosilenae]